MELLVKTLAICAVLAVSISGAYAAPTSDWKPADSPLMTKWAADVKPDKVLSEYPRPQMVRKEWRNLNGVWDVQLTDTARRQILVPFPVESALSGVGLRCSLLQYSREFEVPSAWAGKRILLHFEAVDWETTVSVNGKQVGTHKGGYDPFAFDITDHLQKPGKQHLKVEVSDETGDQPRGKQTNLPHGIWYTPATGIWQTVWLEAVPSQYIREIRIEPGATAEIVRLRADAEGTGEAEFWIMDPETGKEVARGTAPTGEWKEFSWKKPKLWSPDTPFLYDLEVSLNSGGTRVDVVQSYLGLRKVELETGERAQMLLNGKPLFQAGVLDQGYWPDGIYTAPTDEALRFDIEATKKLGFNMARKHVKVEPARWYYWCDKLGLLVWQDMPHCQNASAAAKEQFELELKRMIEARRSHPSIIMWVVFNEGWGQYDTPRITQMAKDMDPTRFVSNASGWTDAKVGDISDTHVYPGPASPNPETTRAVVLGEFGGLGMPVEKHMWNTSNWGYQNVADREQLERSFAHLWRGVYGLAYTHGLGAAVYTQLTDVETETNGLYTYDRKVLKVREKEAARATRGKLAPVQVTTVVPSAKEKPSMWKYTTDKPKGDWKAAGFDDSGWEKGMSGFGAAGTPGGIVNTPWNTREIWLRRTIELPKNVRIRDLVLDMHHDEDVEVFINGAVAAKLSGYTTGYEPVLLREKALQAMKQGPNVIAIHCVQTVGGQYIDAGLSVMQETAPKKRD